VAHLRKPKQIHEAKLTKGTLPQTRSALLARIKAKQKESLLISRRSSPRATDHFADRWP
jgi:hypothetical protein